MSKDRPQYSPSPVPATKDPATVARWAEDEFRAIARHFSETTTLELRPLHAAPAKPRTGMMVYADGTDWNPGGTGEGVYRYTAAATWVKVG